MREKRYYIQRTGAVTGNSATWWRPNGGGYTCDILKAGVYSEAEAERIERGRDGEDKAWLVDDIRGLVEYHIDIHSLRDTHAARRGERP